jgi:hypothetical protein
MSAVAQAWIIVFGCGAIWLVSARAPYRRWGYVLGLVSQPAWFYAAWASGQWGVFAVSVIYLAAWIHGVRNYWTR